MYQAGLMVLISMFLSFSLQAGSVSQGQILRWFGQQPNSYQSATPYGNNPDTGHYVVSGDARIYFEVYGSGKPIVLLHGGIVGSLAEMSQFADKLKHNHLVILVNTRGHGKSDIGSVAPSYQQKAEDVLEVMNTLNLPNADIIGFSDGAYTGYQFAANYPTRVNRLVAIGAGEWQAGFIQGGRKDRNTPFSAIVNLDPDYWQEQAQIRPQQEQITLWFEQANQQYNKTVMSKALFEAINAPVLLLAGENDANAPLDTVLSAYRMLSNAQLAIIPNASHPVFVQNFDAVWACIAPFLDIITID